jgi:hypothetical protein
MGVNNGSVNTTNGFVFTGTSISDFTGTAYGNLTLQGGFNVDVDLTIDINATVTIDSNATVTINTGATLTNNGTIINNGTIYNNGTIIGTVSGNQPIVYTPYYPPPAVSPKPDPEPEPTPEPWKSPFADVREGDWFYGDVEYVVANGLMDGTGAAAFEPNAPMTRAMLITVLARLAGVDTTGGANWYGQGVAWGVESGITDGTRLEERVTRREIATLLYRYAGIGADGWGGEALSWASEQGIMNDGRGDDAATRAEVAAMLHRFAEK